METIYLQHPIAESIAEKMDSCVLALGFFDGVHVGHQGILETAKQMAKQKQCTFGVMTFYPHPKDILFPDREPMTYLTPLPLKAERFEKLGIEKLFIVEFTPEFARLSPEEFVEQFLCGLKCKHVVAGFDYHYGSKGKGTMETLEAYGGGRFGVTTVHKIEHQCEKISSTVIRELLAEGCVKEVPSYLGDFYEVQATVNDYSLFYKNDQFMKVSVQKGYRIPKLGVYQVNVEFDGRLFKGVCHQITVDKEAASLLIQVKDCFADTSSQTVKVRWIDFICAKQNEAYGISEYTQKDELVI